MKIDKNFLKCLLRERALFQYLNLLKRSKDKGIADIEAELRTINISYAVRHYFEHFLKEQGTSIEMLKCEAEKQNSRVSYENMPQIINCSLTWSQTTQGRTFWYVLHKQWIERYASVIIEPICGGKLSEGFVTRYFI